MNIDNVTTSINFINPVNTFVTGEVIVERNEHKSSRLFLCVWFSKEILLKYSSGSFKTNKYTNDWFN